MSPEEEHRGVFGTFDRIEKATGTWPKGDLSFVEEGSHGC
jgi:hypothetical protein